jgi:DHA2 family multidrug resistance protein
VDVVGLALLAAGMGAFQIMLDKGQEDDWFSSRVIVALLAVTVVGLTAFVVRELRTREPIVDFHLFRYTTFTTGTVIGGVLGFVLFGSLVLLPLFMQELLGFPALTAGLWTSPRGIGTVVFLPITGMLLGRRWDPRILLMSGLALASVAFFGYGGLNLSAGGTDFLWPQIIQGAGLAMVFIPLTTIAMDPIPLEAMGFATALYSLIRNMGSSMGISFVTTELARRSQLHQARLVEGITAYNPGVQQATSALGRMIGGESVGNNAQALGVIYGQTVRQASVMSFLDLFHLLGILFLLMIPLVWVMRRPRQRAGQRPPGAATSHD